MALAAIRLLLAFPPADLPRLAEVRLGWREVALTLFLSAVGGAVHALLPVLRRNLGAELLTTSCRGMTQSHRQRFARDVIVVGQVALSLILVAGAVLLFRSFRHLSAVEPGFSQDALTFHVVLPSSRYDSLPSALSFYQRLAAKTESLQDVRFAGMTTALPLTGFDGCSSVYLADRPLSPSRQPPCVPVFLVSPGYFQALGIPVDGKMPEWADLEGRAAVAVVSRALARRLWPREAAVGKGVQVSPGGAPYRVVGVAADVRANGLNQPPVEALYLPLAPAAGDKPRPPVLDLAVVARTTGEPSRIVPAVRRAVRELDSGVPVTEVRSVRELLRSSMSRTSFSALLLAVSSGLAVAFAGLGIYSLLVFLIARRQREIGIRIALGADRGSVARLVLRQSLRLAVVGVGLGLLGASYGTSLLQSLLFEIDPADPATLGIASAFLLLIAGFAAWVPAWKAAHVEPREALHLQ
jgi:predicted permease